MKNILSGAFAECIYLKRVNFNSQLSQKSRVSNCSSKIWWKQSMSQLQQISSNAFSGCLSLQEIRLPASFSIIEERAFADSGLIHVWFESKFHLPTIKECAFQNCQYLLSLHVFDSVANFFTMARADEIAGSFPLNRPFAGCKWLFRRYVLPIAHSEPKTQFLFSSPSLHLLKPRSVS